MFVYSFRGRLVGNLVLLFVLVPIGIVGYLVSYNLAGGLFFLIVNSLILGSVLRLFLTPIHRAGFYADHMEASGRKSFKIRYSDIRQVEKVTVAPLIGPRTLIRISVAGERNQLLVLSNPRSKKLQVDLYSWLSIKTQETTR